MRNLREPTSSLHANMTPMIDVTFLLIVFFVLVSQIVDQDIVPMDLPHPYESQASISEETDHLTINLVPMTNGTVAGIVIAGRTIANDAMSELTAIVEAQLNDGVSEIHLRADSGTQYVYIYEVIETIRNTGGLIKLELVVAGDDL